MVNYYKLIDLETVAKDDSNVPYIYDVKKSEWVADKDNKFMDRLMGYDGDRIGATNMLDRCEKITEEEAMEFIKSN
jgi:hypothetical protein